MPLLPVRLEARRCAAALFSAAAATSATTAVATGVDAASKGITVTGFRSARITITFSFWVIVSVGWIHSGPFGRFGEQQKPDDEPRAVSTRSAAASWWPISAASRSSMRPSAVFRGAPPRPSQYMLPMKYSASASRRPSPSRSSSACRNHPSASATAPSSK